MRTISALAVMLAIMTASGFATRNVYDSLRFHQEMECQKLRGHDRDACFRRPGMSYDDYQRQIKERDQAK
jgi:hypothetical protein